MSLGYTDRESRFLSIVAAHSGHFLRRQFLQFSGAERGYAPQDFLRKAVANRHITANTFTQANYCRYHLFARAVYRALDKEHSSNRKTGSETRVLLKLKVLDFVLENSDEEYLEEESDKVRYFTVECGLDKACLPATEYRSKTGGVSTIRYFVDKFPIFIPQPEVDPGTPLTFTYFESFHEGSESLVTHLETYRPLFKALKTPFRFLYVANKARYFELAEKRFNAVLSRHNQEFYSPSMLAYFRLRKMWEEKRFAEFTDPDINRLNRGAKYFSRDEHQARYRQWLTTEVQRKEDASGPRPPSQSSAIFETYLLRR